ncbi:MAG TPA: hypothetical protein VH592_08375 [Gemmataceae bacterium]|jgi:hypothetical protein
MAGATTNVALEGQRQVVDKKERKEQQLTEMVDLLIDQFGTQSPCWKRYEDLTQQKIRLEGNGVEMKLGMAHDSLSVLRELQEQAPDQFLELVRIVRPRGATRLPEPSARLVIARGGLKERGILSPDGFEVEPRLAAVLDAAYTETKKGVLLRETAVYSSPGLAEELASARKKAMKELVSLAAEDIQAKVHNYRLKENYRRMRDDDAPHR